MSLSVTFFFLKGSSLPIKRFFFLAVFSINPMIFAVNGRPKSSLSTSSVKKNIIMQVATKDKQKIAEHLIYFPALSSYLFGLSAVHSGRFQLYELSGHIEKEIVNSEIICSASSRMVYIVKSNMFSVEMSERVHRSFCQEKASPARRIKVTKLK